ncbi:MAG: hypothetical protein N4A71_13325 [Carboxylicivirga sp.]|jgi:hypothetical protein|nr:hypothetical protein [Carboxylicivirga sp.]
MLDFWKILIKGIEPDSLFQNELLEFDIPICPETGQVKPWSNSPQGSSYHRAKYQDLTFKIHKSRAINLSGSIHKFWNQGTHNHNDFSNDNLIRSLHEINAKFGIEPENMVLNQMEFGINLIIKEDPNKILDSCFFHQKKQFEIQKVRDGYYKRVEHTNYYEIKIYNKTSQQKYLKLNTPGNLLRIEIKYKSRQLKKMGIYTMHDYLQADPHIFLNDLINKWNEILFYDWTISVSKPSDILTLLNFQNPMYWKNLINEKADEKYKRHRKKLRYFIQNNSRNIKQKIANLIREKGEQLLKTTLKYTSIKTDIRVINKPEIKRRCIITGVDITSQRKGSRIASVKGLYNLYKTDPDSFMDLINEYLSKRKFENFMRIMDQTLSALSYSISNRYNNNRKKIENGERLQPMTKKNRKK